MAITACGSSEGTTKLESPSEVTQDSSQEKPASTTSSLPNFSLISLEGRRVRLTDYLGTHVILIDFWATFCDPCLLAMPHLNDLYVEFRERDFVVLGVSVDGPQSAGRVRSTVRKLGVDFPILLDPETEALSLYNPKTSVPYSLLIDRDGKIIERKEGFAPRDVSALRAHLEEATSPPKSPER